MKFFKSPKRRALVGIIGIGIGIFVTGLSSGLVSSACAYLPN